MEIPKKIREQIDFIYSAPDNMNYVIDYKGQYLLKKGNNFVARNLHHIDRNRANNEIWNLVPLSYQDHIIGIHTKNDPKIKKAIYEFMSRKFPEHEDHYRQFLL